MRHIQRRQLRPPEAYVVGIYFQCEIFDLFIPAITCINQKREKDNQLCIECRQFMNVVKQIAKSIRRQNE